MWYIRLHVEGVLQSWATLSRGTKVRDTEHFPTKSGILGNIANALCLQRGDERLSLMHRACRVSTRPLREGTIHKDYHIMQGVRPVGEPEVLSKDFTTRRNLSGTKSKGSVFSSKIMHEAGGGTTKPSHRFYLNDWAFEVVLEWDDTIAPFTADQVVDAVRRPSRVLYLGRKSCLPTLPLIGPGVVPIKADSPREVFRAPTQAEVGFMYLPNLHLPFEEWFAKRYPLATPGTGPMVLDLPNGVPEGVPVELYDHYDCGNYRKRVVYQVPPQRQEADNAK